MHKKSMEVCLIYSNLSSFEKLIHKKSVKVYFIYSKLSNDDLLALIYLFLKTKRKRKMLEYSKIKKRKIWVCDILQQHENFRLFHTLVQEMQFRDRDCYFKYV